MRIQDIQFILDAMPINMKIHANNTACLAFAMGRAINCSINELITLYFSGLLHESGKLIISGKLLLPVNDTLNNLDAHLKNKKHMLFTLELLDYLINKYPFERDDPDDISLMDYPYVKFVINQTFENVNGSGEPNQRTADDIDTLAKVLRISLEYDNYRLNGLPHDQACKQLKDNANIIFPPRIITPFIKAIVINGIHKEYEEENFFEICGAPDFDLHLSCTEEDIILEDTTVENIVNTVDSICEDE